VRWIDPCSVVGTDSSADIESGGSGRVKLAGPRWARVCPLSVIIGVIHVCCRCVSPAAPKYRVQGEVVLEMCVLENNPSREESMKCPPKQIILGVLTLRGLKIVRRA
jgi:hypothetical protein